MKNNNIVPGFDDDYDNYFRMKLKIINKRPSSLLIYLKGHFSIQSTQILQRRIAKAIEWGYVRLVFDLGNISFRSAGRDELIEAITDLIGSLTAFIKAVKPRGGDVVLIRVQPDFYEALRLIDFVSVFNIQENLSRAEKFLIKGITLDRNKK